MAGYFALVADPLSSAFNVYPVAGLPGGDASRFLRADFRMVGETGFSEFESLIETKCPRLAWARAALCPCLNENEQTKQPDPTCPSCSGNGWRYFQPEDYVNDPDTLGELDVLQTSIVTAQRAVLIRGLLTGIATQPDIFHVLGKWALGSSMLSVRPRNRVAYYDRITQIDEVMPFCEVVEVPDDSDFLPTRYPVHSINFIGTLTEDFDDETVQLFDDGTIGWQAGATPAAGTRVSINYMHHPVWVCIEYVNAMRTSLVKFRNPRTQTPQGDTVDLPVRVMIRREYLPSDPPETAP